VSAQVVDVSRTGIGLLMSETLPSGTRVQVELDALAGTLFEMLADVVNVHELADGTYRCGCSLVWPLSEDELRLLTKST
jgi:hypothetical protein